MIQHILSEAMGLISEYVRTFPEDLIEARDQWDTPEFTVLSILLSSEKTSGPEFKLKANVHLYAPSWDAMVHLYEETDKEIHIERRLYEDHSYEEWSFEVNDVRFFCLKGTKG